MIDPCSNRQNAIDKAEALRWWTRADRVTENVWMVSGTAPSAAYRVTHLGPDRWACTCQAGQAGTACYHQAAAFLAKLRDDSARSIAAERVAAVSAPASVATTLRAAGGGRSTLALDEEEQAARDFYGALAGR